MFKNTRILILSVACAALLSVALPLLGFALLESRWPPGQINMEMQLGSSGALDDGSADWDECAIGALAEWNANLDGSGISYSAVRGSTVTPAENDQFNNVFFSDDIFGDAFGENTLAVATGWYLNKDGINERTESDVIFNKAKAFNCYRGPLKAGDVDLRRVALHEFGHTVGLGHPDEGDSPQTVDAIMNSFVGDTETLQLDDIQGALTLYGVAVTGIPFPPRDQVLTFFLNLEDEYRDTLGRSQTNQGFVDAEGSAVWFPEWLRYVLNGCFATIASERVLMQIRTGAIQPVCGVVASGTIEFPPRNQSLDFLNTLDTFYRDELNRSMTLSYIDLEGKAVWLQEYLRYRVNGCNEQQATDHVFTQIRGGGIPSVCARSMTGTWTGVWDINAACGNYPNVTLRLVQSPAGVVSGDWDVPSHAGRGCVGVSGPIVEGTMDDNGNLYSGSSPA
jgi:hypothetical protein